MLSHYICMLTIVLTNVTCKQRALVTSTPRCPTSNCFIYLNLPPSCCSSCSFLPTSTRLTRALSTHTIFVWVWGNYMQFYIKMHSFTSICASTITPSRFWNILHFFPCLLCSLYFLIGIKQESKTTNSEMHTAVIRRNGSKIWSMSKLKYINFVNNNP